MSWHLKVFNDSDGKLFRLTSFCAGPQGHQQRIGRRDVSVMCQYVSLRASWCRVKKSVHFISFDAIWQINWCHLMSLDASSVTCQCANRFCLVEESTQSRDDFLECMRTAPDRPGIVPFFSGEDELLRLDECAICSICMDQNWLTDISVHLCWVHRVQLAPLAPLAGQDPVYLCTIWPQRALRVSESLWVVVCV